MRTLSLIATAATILLSVSANSLGQEAAEPRATEILLRRHIEGMRLGKPIYESMTAAVATAVRPYELSGRQRIEQLGAIRSIEFRGETSIGVDNYFVQYENGATEYRIRLSNDGKINALVLRPIAGTN